MARARRGRVRANAGKCGRAEKLFLALDLSARRSGIAVNPLYYNHLRRDKFSGIYRKTP